MKKGVVAYGIIGLVLIILIEISLFFNVKPFDKFYFPLVWIGYILFMDSLAYIIRKKSLIMNNFPVLMGMFIFSMPFWKLFEYLNMRVQNWNYIGTEYFGVYGDLFAMISFSTVIPAFFITLQLFDFDFKKTIPKDRMSGILLFWFIILGLIMLFLPLIWPQYFFPLIWIFLFFILDPINYWNKQPSLIYMVMTKQKAIWKIVASVLLLGILWEFWNYWASVKWVYTIPYFDFLRVFEMPILGYLGYIPFGFEIFATWFFIVYLFKNLKF